jgi:Mg2+/Co2+ transporter CorC
MVRLASTRIEAATPSGAGTPQVETYYPTVETRVRVSPTAAGLALLYETGFQVNLESLRFTVSEPAAESRRVLTIEIEYTQEPRCPSEL